MAGDIRGTGCSLTSPHLLFFAPTNIRTFEPGAAGAFVTQKGGSGKTTLAACVAVAAAGSGEKVIALDFDLQGSLTRWGQRRAANSPCKIAIEQFETARLGRLGALLHRLDDAGFTL